MRPVLSVHEPTMTPDESIPLKSVEIALEIDGRVRIGQRRGGDAEQRRQRQGLDRSDVHAASLDREQD